MLGIVRDRNWSVDITVKFWVRQGGKQIKYFIVKQFKSPSFVSLDSDLITPTNAAETLRSYNKCKTLELAGYFKKKKRSSQNKLYKQKKSVELICFKELKH